MKVKSQSEVAQSCPTLSDPIDSSPPGSPVPGILQARILECEALARDGVSREVPCSALKGETVPDSDQEGRRGSEEAVPGPSVFP